LALLIMGYLIAKKRPLVLKLTIHTFLACAGVAVYFIWLVLYPRLVLRQPTTTSLGPGKNVIFYSLSRSARMLEPGRFLLREDGRSYRFYMTTEQPLRELRISLGSTQGDYEYSISLFDEVLARGRTVRGIQEFTFPNPPLYRLGETSFYTIILELGKDAHVRPELNPYLFSLSY